MVENQNCPTTSHTSLPGVVVSGGFLGLFFDDEDEGTTFL